MTKIQTGSISFEATGGFNSYAKQNYATLSQIKGQFATSETGKSTVDKVATVVPANTDWSLFNGATVTVKFTSANEAMNPTLNVNGSGAKPIRDYKGNELTAEAMKWKEGAALAFTYDGTYWRLQDSDLMQRIYSAETAIEQNANDITLKASKEELEQSIDDVKITKSICGRSIITEDAADLPLLSLDSVYGESVQDGTPTPSSPINIKSVRGCNGCFSKFTSLNNVCDERFPFTVSSSGYSNHPVVITPRIDNVENIFGVDYTVVKSASYFSDSSSTSEGSNIRLGKSSDFILEAGKAITFGAYIKASGSHVGNILFRIRGGASNSSYGTLATTIIPQTGAFDWTYVTVTYIATSDTYINDCLMFIVRTGVGSSSDYETIYTAGFFIAYGVYLEQVPYSNLGVTSVGRNLVPPYAGVGRVQANGTIYTNGSDDGQLHRYSPYISVIAGSNYTLSVDFGAVTGTKYLALAWYTSSFTLISRDTNASNTSRMVFTFTAPVNAAYVRVSSRAESYGTTLQLEFGSIATEYEPYRSCTKFIDLKGIELHGLDDTYRDILSIDESGHAVIEKRTGKTTVGDMTGMTKYGTDNVYFGKVSDMLGQDVLEGTTHLNTHPLYSDKFKHTENADCVWSKGAVGYFTRHAVAAYPSYNHSIFFKTETDYSGGPQFQEAFSDTKIVYPLDEFYTIDLGYIDLPQVTDNATVYIAAEVQPQICGSWWTKSGQEAGKAHQSSVKKNAELRIAADGITSEVSKISSAKYVTTGYNYTLAQIKTYAAEGYSGTWTIASDDSIRVGDTVYVKVQDTTRTCPVYIKVKVTAISSPTRITCVSHGYEDVLPVDTIKSTINQSSDSIKISANHVDIEGAAIFSSGGTYDKSTTVVKTETQWYSSTSATSKSGGSWGTTQPTITAGRYIWQRELVTYASGSTAYKPTEAGVCIQGQTDLSSYSTTAQMNSAIGTAVDNIEAASWTWYAESSSGAADVAKVAIIKPETDNFVLKKGQRIGVSFSATNTAAVASLTLNVNNTGAKPIKYTVSGGDVGNLPAVGYLKANRVYDFIYDGTNWVLQYNYNTDTVNRTRWQNVIKAAGAITAGKLICGTANGYQNVGAGVSFDLSYPVLYASAAIAVGSTGDNNYLQLNGVNLTTTATIQNPAQYATVFLKGKITGNTFTVDSTNVLTCTIPTSADDYFYMPLGMFYNSTTNIYFNSSTALWAYIDGRFRAVTPTEIVASQRIYYRSKVSGTVAKPSTWITEINNKFNNTTTVGNSGWSTKVTPISSGKGKDVTKYLYLYTCEQRKRLDGTIDCTTVLLDDSTTIIDGGNIITGSVTANELNAASINASNILTIGAFDTDEQQNILNSEISVGGRNLLAGNAGKPGKWTVSAPATANFTKVESNNGYNVNISFNTVSGYENLNSPAITVEPNQQYTLSCDYTVNKAFSNAVSTRSYGVSVRTDSGNHSSADDFVSNSLGQAVFKTTVGAAHTSLTFTPTVSTIYLCLNGGNLLDNQSGLSFDVRNIKLEKGNQDTDWTPAPEDIQSGLDNAAPKTSAVSRTQRIYYQSASTTKPSTPGTASSNWVTDETGAADKWTLKRMSYSSTKPYIYTCEQKQVVSGTVSYTPVLLDDTTTVIDGGKIITGSVTANQIAASAITAEKIKAGAIGTNQLAANAVTADKIQAGAIAIGDFNAETANLLNTAYSTANSAYSTANNAAKTATNYIYADSAGIRIASASPSSANQRLHLTSSTATFYDGGNNQRISINSSSGVIVGHPSRGRVQVVDAGINIFDNSNKKRVSVDSSGFHVYDTTGTTEVALMGANTARLGSTTNSAFYLNSNSLQAYYMSGTNRIKYFEVTPTGMSYGNNAVASQSYVTGQGYQTAAQVSNTANTIANTAANTYVTNRDKAQYGKCSTAANIAQKDVACDTFPDTLVVGMRITVDFTNANTEITPKLKVGTTTAKSIKFNGAVGSATDPIRWGAKARLTFQYDGTNWCLDEQPPTYSATGTLSNGVTTVNKNGALIVNGTTVAVRYSTANTYVSGALSLNLSTTGNATIYNDNKATSTTNILTWSANTILTFVREGSYWYLTDRSDAKTTASNYMYFDSTNGLRIAQSSPSSATTSYVQIKNDGIKIVSNNANAFMDISSSAIKIQRSSTSYALIDTSAIKLQTSNTNYVNISSSTIKLQTNDQNYIVLSNNNGLTFYKSGKLVSSFGETTVLHNTKNNAYVKLDYHSLQLIDKDNNSYLHASDLRDESGYANVIDNFKGDGSTKDFYVTATPYSSSELQVKVNNVVQTQNTQWVYYTGRPHITFNQAPSINAIITVSYRTIDSVVAFTFGKRGSGNIGIYSFCTGFNNVASGCGAYAEGANTIASGTYSHAEGQNTRANGSYSHAEGYNTTTKANYTHTEGCNTVADGNYSHAEGHNTRANGFASHAEGYNTIADGNYSHAEGHNTRANGFASHAGGHNTIADGNYSHAEGHNTRANGLASHAEGYNTIANGYISHAEGQNTRASGNYSHAGGHNTIASYTCQTAIGQYNRTCTAYFVVGAGSADNSRRNALEVYSSSAYFNGTTSASGTSITSDIRVKEKIKLLNQNDAIDFIKKLKPSSYIKNGDRKELGFIAQEIEALDKYGDYLVSKDSSGAYDLKDFRLLDYQGLIAPTVAALQAALEKIEILETKVKELESKLR